jgi:hypothetical protein
MAMFQNDLIRRLPPTMGSSLANTHLEIPLEMPINEARSFVLAAGSRSDYRLVVLPIRTILFVQQYAAVLAYYGCNGCPIIQPLLYAKMLASDKAIGLRPPGPLDAFGLTNDIYQDQFTKDVADKLTKSALFFILAHELGHLFYNHVPNL